MRPRALLLMCGLFVLGVAVFWSLDRLTRRVPTDSAPDEIDVEALRKSLRHPVMGAARPPAVAPTPANDSPGQTNRFARLARVLAGEDQEEDQYKLTRQQIEDYLARSHRSAESLLAAAQLSDLAVGSELLLEAVKKFPNDPRVQFALLTAHTNYSGLSAEDRRKWLEAFKQSAPDNSLPALLSAREYFKSGDSRAAVNELVAALGDRRYSDFLRDSVQNTEEAYLGAGYSPAEAKAVTMNSMRLPQLTELSQLGRNLSALEQQYRAAGEVASADGLRMTGVQIGQRLNDSSSPTMLQELVAMGFERRFLTNAVPSFVDGPARLAQIDSRRQAIKELVAATVTLPDILIQSGNEAEIISFYDRMKLYGEYSALLWLKDRQSNPP